MEAKIKAIHFDITDKLVNFINKKTDKLSRRFEAITEVEVTLKVVKPETSMNKEAGIRRSVRIEDRRHIRGGRGSLSRCT